MGRLPGKAYSGLWYSRAACTAEHNEGRRKGRAVCPLTSSPPLPCQHVLGSPLQVVTGGDGLNLAGPLPFTVEDGPHINDALASPSRDLGPLVRIGGVL